MLAGLILTMFAAARVEPVKVCSASFSDVGIFGGLEVYLSAPSHLWVRHIYPPGNPALRERRYHVTLDATQPWDLGYRVAAFDFLKLKNSSRSEAPDEPVARITITVCGRSAFSVRQYELDANPRFWVVMDWFLIQWRAAKDTDPIYEGAVDHTWTAPIDVEQGAPDKQSNQRLPNNETMRTKHGQGAASPLISVLDGF